MTDQITLTLPRERPYFGVARLVLGGLAARHDVTVESLDDLELALDALLERRDAASEITLALEVDGDDLHAGVGPFEDQSLKRELAGESGESMSLRRLLDALVDGYELSDRDDGAWISMRKRVERG